MAPWQQLHYPFFPAKVPQTRCASCEKTKGSLKKAITRYIAVHPLERETRATQETQHEDSFHLLPLKLVRKKN